MSTCVDISKSSRLPDRKCRAVPRRENGDGDVALRCVTFLGGDGLAGECEDATLRCRKLPIGLHGDGTASAVGKDAAGT